MSFITGTKSIFVGGGNYVDCHTLKNGKILCINEDMVVLYDSMEDAEESILGEEPFNNLMINGFYF